MKDVANKFFLNPSYFCSLFKDETGYNFTHYLTRTRIEKAKELLAQSSKKLYDIAAEVGYTNVQYFSTIFKEVEGITPSQFRAEYHRNIPSAD
jgi:YesN/AraC family two-component response regulator